MSYDNPLTVSYNFGLHDFGAGEEWTASRGGGAQLGRHVVRHRALIAGDARCLAEPHEAGPHPLLAHAGESRCLRASNIRVILSDTK